MFELCWTPEAEQNYGQLKEKAERSYESRQKNKKKKPSKDEGLFKQVHKTLLLLQSNPRHPGLQTHEYDGLVNPYDSKKKVWEAYAQNNTPGAYRIFWCYGEARELITIIAITPHP